ncbi:MAG: copper resistance protein CopC [Ramlibacter sp.]|nr:copper resistance protein CopC [Cryobacterium sp.]
MNRVWLRRASGLTAILMAVFVLVLFGATPAWAHSELERSDPPNEGVIAVGRSTFTLWFTEAVSAQASSFELHTSDGARVATEVSVSQADDKGIVRISTRPLAKATYALDWKVFAVDDGHTTQGSVVFGVGTRPAVIAPSAGGIFDPSGLLLRWIDLSAIMLAIGAVVVSGRVFGSMGEMGVSPRRRSLLVGALALGVAVVSGAVAPFLLTQRGGSSLGEWFGTTWATLTGIEWGHLWLAREIALAIAAGTVYWATRTSRAEGRLMIAALALAPVVGLEAWAGHASSLPSGSALAVVASASHLVAAGVWAGGLAILAFCLIPMMRIHPDARARILGSAWRSFGPMAAIATAVLVATGIYEAGLHIPDLSFVAATVYGGAVAAKLVLVIVALALAAINTMLVNPPLAARVGRVLRRQGGWVPLSRRRFVTVVAAEVFVLAVAVGAAGVLTSVPTAREIAIATRQTELHTATVDGLFVTLEEVAAGQGQSRLIVRSRSIVKLEEAPVSAVSVALAGPTGTREVQFDRIEPGRYEAETVKPGPGAWIASVSLERDGLPTAVTRLRLTVPAENAETVRPLQLVTSALAVLLLAVALGALLTARRRPEPAVEPASLHEFSPTGRR